MQLEIDDQLLEGYTPAARNRLKTETLEFVRTTVDEASRLEGARANRVGPKEISDATVADAVDYITKTYLYRAQPKIALPLRVTNGVMPVITGLLTAFADLNNFWHVVLVSLSVIVSVILITIVAAKENSSG